MKFLENVEKPAYCGYRLGDFHTLLLENMAEGAAVNRFITDSEGNRRDYRILDVNPAYERILGIYRDRAVGCSASDLYGDDDAPYFHIYVRVAETGIPERFETEYPGFGKVFDTTVFSPEGEYFVVVFSDVRERKEAEARLQRELEEKKVLLREIHHRVKNNLTVVSSLLRLQADMVESAEDARRALEDSLNRVYSMALVHDHIYQTSCFSRIGMRWYISDFIEVIENHYCGDKRIDFSLSLEDICLDITLAVPVGIILNELLTNSLEHALRKGEGGSITVVLEQTGRGFCTLRVRDDGAGFQDTESPKDPDKLRLELIKILTKQIRGELVLHGGGSREIEITFPFLP